MPRTLLTRFALTWLGLGFCVLIYFALSTLLPSAKTENTLLKIPTAHLKPGEFLITKDAPNEFNDTSSRVLLVRDIDLKLYAWYVPYRGEQAHLPDWNRWWQAGNACRGYQVSLEKDSIFCLTPETSAITDTAYRWHINGQPWSAKQGFAMLEVQGVEENGEFIFLKYKSSFFN